MAKKKFLEQRRKRAAADLRNQLDARGLREDLVRFLDELGLEFEEHWSEDENDHFEGFELDVAADQPYDRTWYIVKNPNAGPDLELSVEYSFDLMFGSSCWSYRPTAEGYRKFCETIKGIVTGRAAGVEFYGGGEYHAASAVLGGGDLNTENELRFLNRIAERDYHNMLRIMYGNGDVSLNKEYKKLLKMRNKGGCVAKFRYWNPEKDWQYNFR